jgi:hypothetical protein
MKLEFLASGSPDCPLIRLFAFDDEEVARLRILMKSLSSGSTRNVALHEQPGFEPVNACRLYLRAGKSDGGLRAVAPGVFECVLSEEAWDNMAELVEPLCESAPQGYQWLIGSPRISLLLSRDGSW